MESRRRQAARQRHMRLNAKKSSSCKLRHQRKSCSNQTQLDKGAIRHALVTAYKGNKSSGPSALPSQLVKHLHMGNDESLATMFQAVASIGIPPEWNLTRITPVHKKGPKQDAANYRPVSVMGPLAKLFSSCLNLDLER